MEPLEDRILQSLRPSERPDDERMRPLLQLAQQMAQAGVDPLDPSRVVLARLGDRWSALLLCILGTGPYRHRELRRVINAVRMHFGDTTLSQRMMTLNLRTLERDGLVSRTAIAGKVPSVEYSLSPLGASLLEQILQLMRWCLTHGDRMREAQQAYDARQEAAADEPLDTD
jgi:DNA-binding HxlR family transcriptional regulator